MVLNFDINGVLLIDKPFGVSSANVDYKIKAHLAKILNISKKNAPKVGHAGTLDPFATGLQIIGIGSDTKSLHIFEQCDKTYFARITLGKTSTTDDLTSDLNNYNKIDDTELLKRLALLRDEQIHSELNRFLGKQSQMPSKYSAKRVNGRRAYELMRDGENFELRANEITVHNIDIIKIEHYAEKIEIDVRFFVSKGTFIRAIARDLGNNLKIGGYLTSLRREKIGDYSLENAVSLESLQKIDNLDNFEKLLIKNSSGSVITFGKFDGVHLGHQKLLRELAKTAKNNRQKSIVFLIDTFLGNSQISTLPQRIAYIKSCGIKEVIVLSIDKIKNIEYSDFLKDLKDKYNVKHIFLTNNSVIGHGKVGNVKKISQFARLNAIDCTIVDMFHFEGDQVSSARIRDLLNENDSVNLKKSDKYFVNNIKLVKDLLGKSYKVSGKVVHGFQRGRKIGFPTANLADIETIIPSDGVYFGSVSWQNESQIERHAAMISIGNNPTFDNRQRTVEVHIPTKNACQNNCQNGCSKECEGWFELYDKRLTLSFDSKIRGMTKFDSIDALKCRLKYDAELTLCAAAIQNDKCVIIPTDTVLGICCKYDDSVASKIYKIKQRDYNKPLQVLISSMTDAFELGVFSSRAIEISEQYWGKTDNSIAGLTLVIPKRNNDISEYKKNDLIGLRIAKNSPIKDLVKIVGPIYASSANISQQSEFKNSEEAREILREVCDDNIYDQICFFECNKLPYDSKFSSGVASKVIKVVDDCVEYLR